jgi:septum formation protein
VVTSIVLASASPRRAELLRAAGLDFDVLPASVDESPLPAETAEAHVRRLAEAKALAVVDRAGSRRVIAADTVVVIDGAIFGKPADEDDARRMLRLLSGRAHEVVTGVSLAAMFPGGPGWVVQTEVERTTVEFEPLSEAEIDWYVASGEPMDKAGAYAVQGLASRFVTRIAGSYSNVVGLPVALVYTMLTKNSDILQGRSPARAS